MAGGLPDGFLRGLPEFYSMRKRAVEFAGRSGCVEGAVCSRAYTRFAEHRPGARVQGGQRTQVHSGQAQPMWSNSELRPMLAKPN